MTVEQDKNIPTNTGEHKDEGVGIPEPKKDENQSQLSQEDIKELLALKKENEQRKLQEQMYGSIGGKAKFEEMTRDIAGSVSEEERGSINALLKSGNMESIKAGVTMVKSIHSRLNTQAPEAPSMPDVPGIGQAAAPIPSNTQQSKPNGEKATPAAEASLSNVIDYANITKPQVKAALDKINDELLDFQSKHYGQDFDLTDITNRKAVDVLDRLVEVGIAQGDRKLAEEAMIVYNSILQANIKSGIKNEDPIPARLWENAGQLVHQRNVENRITGKQELNFFEEEFAVNELEQATIDNLFARRRTF